MRTPATPAPCLLGPAPGSRCRTPPALTALDETGRAAVANALLVLFRLAQNLGEPGEGPAPG